MKSITVIFLLMIIFGVMAQDDSYPTSPWLNITYYDSSGQKHQTCGVSDQLAERNKSYVSLRVENIVIFRDSRWNDIFRKKMHTFAAGGINASLANSEYKLEKVSPTYRVQRRQDTIVDIPTGWTLLDTVPWNISNGSVTVKVGFSDESLIKGIIDKFSTTVGAENISLNAAWTSGVNIISFLDSVANTGDDVKFLSYSNDIPLGADALCAGRYVVFAAPESSKYRTYQEHQNHLLLENSVLKFKGRAIDNVSYVIFSVGVDNKKYLPIDKYKDSGTIWAQKYAEARRLFSNLVRRLSIAQEVLNEGDNTNTAYIIDRDTKLLSLAKLFTKENRNLLDTEFNKLKAEGDVLLKLDNTLYQTEKDDIEFNISNEFDETVVQTTVLLKQFGLIDTEEKRIKFSSKMVKQDVESGNIDQLYASTLNENYSRGEFEEIDSTFIINNFSDKINRTPQIDLNNLNLQEQLFLFEELKQGHRIENLQIEGFNNLEKKLEMQQEKLE